MSALAKYDQARQALAACRNVDEIKDIRDKSEAMRLYAKQAQDTELEQWAAEIKFRAQRAIGELSATLPTQKGGFGIVPTGGKHKAEVLQDAGISTSTANRYEKLAAIPEPVIEEIIAKSKEAGKPVSAKAVMASVAPKAAPRAPTPAGADTPSSISPTMAPAAAPAPSLVQQVHDQQAAADEAMAAAGTGPEEPAPEPDPFDQLLADFRALELERDDLQAKNATLEQHVALLTKDDLAAQVDGLVRRADAAELKFEQLSGRNRQLQQTAREAQLAQKSQADMLAKIRAALGVESSGEILPAITARRAA